MQLLSPLPLPLPEGEQFCVDGQSPRWRFKSVTVRRVCPESQRWPSTACTASLPCVKDRRTSWRAPSPGTALGTEKGPWSAQAYGAGCVKSALVAFSHYPFAPLTPFLSISESAKYKAPFDVFSFLELCLYREGCQLQIRLGCAKELYQMIQSSLAGDSVTDLLFIGSWAFLHSSLGESAWLWSDII